MTSGPITGRTLRDLPEGIAGHIREAARALGEPVRPAAAHDRPAAPRALPAAPRALPAVRALPAAHVRPAAARAPGELVRRGAGPMGRTGCLSSAAGMTLRRRRPDSTARGQPVDRAVQALLHPVRAPDDRCARPGVGRATSAHLQMDGPAGRDGAIQEVADPTTHGPGGLHPTVSDRRSRVPS